VVKHALTEWDLFRDYRPPSPEKHDGWGPIDWNRIRERIAEARKTGRLAAGGLRHGHTFLTLTYLRGYENLVFDMCDEHPQLPSLIEMVEEFNRGLVKRYVEAGVEWMRYPEDLGMQQGPMLSPSQFRQYIKPTYKRLVSSARQAGCVIHMHSDGDIRKLADDLADVGIDVINLQDLVNGIDWIGTALRGRVCIDLDIDRQSITRFGTPEQIDEHVLKAVRKLGSSEGGLMLRHGLYPGVPLENVRALMDAMEKYSKHFS
jgi:uroporphyrinogen-III decarboxylase